MMWISSVLLAAALFTSPAAAVYTAVVDDVDYRLAAGANAPTFLGIINNPTTNRASAVWLGAIVSVENDLGTIGRTVVAGQNFPVGLLTLVNGARTAERTTARPQFVLNLNVIVDLSTVLDDIDVPNVEFTFIETINADFSGQVTNVPDLISVNVAGATKTITVTVGTTSVDLTIEILGLTQSSDYNDLSKITNTLFANENSLNSAVIVAKLIVDDENTEVNGDPHFLTWTGDRYDFHGECDLMFLHNPDFANGLGMDIHMRTKMRRQWSYVDQVALRIGNDVLEIKGGDENLYWINGEAGVALPATIGGYLLSFRQMNSKQRQFLIKLDGDQEISIQIFKDFVAVNIHHAHADSFGTSTGMSGHFVSGQLLGRDGTTVITDPLAFGAEWQLRPEDGPLFRMLEGVQYPTQCRMPTSAEAQERRRRLGDSSAKLHDAEQACAHVKSDPGSFDNCVFDVLLTDDLEMAGAY